MRWIEVICFFLWLFLIWIVVFYSIRLVVYWDSVGIYICVYYGIFILLWVGVFWFFIYLFVCIISVKVVCERKFFWWIFINDVFYDLLFFIRGMLLVLYVNSMIININFLVFNFYFFFKVDSKFFLNLLVKSFIIK